MPRSLPANEDVARRPVNINSPPASGASTQPLAVMLSGASSSTVSGALISITAVEPRSVICCSVTEAGASLLRG